MNRKKRKKTKTESKVRLIRHPKEARKQTVTHKDQSTQNKTGNNSTKNPKPRQYNQNGAQQSAYLCHGPVGPLKFNQVLIQNVAPYHSLTRIQFGSRRVQHLKPRQSVEPLSGVQLALPADLDVHRNPSYPFGYTSKTLKPLRPF